MPFSQSLLLLREHGGSVVKVYVTDDDLATINQTFLSDGQPRTAGKIFAWSSVQALLQDALFLEKLKRQCGLHLTDRKEHTKGMLIYRAPHAVGSKAHIAWADLSPTEQAQCTLGNVNSHSQARFIPRDMKRAPTTDTITVYFSTSTRERQWNFNIRGVVAGQPLASQPRRGNLTDLLGRVWFHKDNLGE